MVITLLWTSSTPTVKVKKDTVHIRQLLTIKRVTFEEVGLPALLALGLQLLPYAPRPAQPLLAGSLPV